MNFGSTCIYPRMAEQPIREESLLTGEAVEDAVYADVRKDGRRCRMEWDTSKPNGTPRKLCDVSHLAALGWRAKVGVREGIRIAYEDFLHGDVRK